MGDGVKPIAFLRTSMENIEPNVVWRTHGIVGCINERLQKHVTMT